MKFLNNIVGFVASILTILNFILAIPSVFQNIDGIEILEITKNNFTLKLGFILLLEFGFGYLFTYFLRSSQNTNSSFQAHTAGILISLCSAWLTFFNITEILYSGEKVTTSSGLSAMFFYISLSLIIQCSMIIFSDSAEFSKWKFSKRFWVIVIAILEIIYFFVYAKAS